jgi:hypothetical protein
MTQPSLARYLMGFSLQAVGYDLLYLNRPWARRPTADENIAHDRMPTTAMLVLARLPITVAAALSVLLVFLLGSQMGGWVAGIGAALWPIANPAARVVMTRASMCPNARCTSAVVSSF